MMPVHGPASFGTVVGASALLYIGFSAGMGE